MQFLTSLIGGSGNMILNAALALGVVLILIFLGLWALKLIFRASSNVGRGSKRRLAIVDSLPVDGRRQLIIIRRDNVEHLILTGGPQDLVVETGIAAEAQSLAPRPIPVVRRPLQAGTPAPQAPLRAPLPQRAPSAEAVAPIVPPMPPVASNDESAPRSPLDRLRELGRSGERRPPSLRHTGLMRPVSRMEPAMIPANADNSVPARPDSATTGRVMPFGGPRGDGNGQAFGGDDNPDGHRDEGY
jgi:flagellar protein FliO/FliZ